MGILVTVPRRLDGQRVLTVKEEEMKPQPVTEMILVQNWLEELKGLVPVKQPEKELAKGYERQFQFDGYCRRNSEIDGPTERLIEGSFDPGSRNSSASAPPGRTDIRRENQLSLFGS
jgi:hypothetical protein